MANEMNRAQAERLLGLTGSYGYDDAHEAYRQAVKANHPDAANAASKASADKKTVELNAAWSMLKKEFRNRPDNFKFSAGKSDIPESVDDIFNDSIYEDIASAFQRTKEEASRVENNRGTREKAWETYRYQETYGETLHQEAHAAADQDFEPFVQQQARPMWAKFIVGALNLPLWRIGFLLLAMAVYAFLFDEIPSSSTPDAIAGKEEMYFWSMGLILLSALNLFTGHITGAARKSCLWLVDKICHLAPEETGSPIKKILRHLPYRLIFLAFATGWYWYFAAFQADSAGALDWPLRVLVFLIAAINFAFPIITDPLRKALFEESDYGRRH